MEAEKGKGKWAGSLEPDPHELQQRGLGPWDRRGEGKWSEEKENQRVWGSEQGLGWALGLRELKAVGLRRGAGILRRES